MPSAKGFPRISLNLPLEGRQTLIAVRIRQVSRIMCGVGEFDVALDSPPSRFVALASLVGLAF